MTFKVSPGIANHRYTGCRAYFETHTRSLWVCLHLCLCHTWYLSRTPLTQDKGLISPTFPPLWVCLFSAPGVILRYGLLWYATSFLLSYPLSYLWMIIISDPHSVYLGNLPLKYLWKHICGQYLWTIFVDNICGQSSSLTLICRQSIGISWEFATQSVFFLQSAVALCWARSCAQAPAERKTRILKGFFLKIKLILFDN